MGRLKLHLVIITFGVVSQCGMKLAGRLDASWTYCLWPLWFPALIFGSCVAAWAVVVGVYAGFRHLERAIPMDGTANAPGSLPLDD